MENIEVEKIRKLIKYCPHCGSKSEKEFCGLLSNGGDWTCIDCKSKVEAYVLSQ